MYMFNMLVSKPSWITLLLLLCRHGVEGILSLACEGDTLKLRCDWGYIRVNSANYGRLSIFICSRGKSKEQVSNYQCLQEGTLPIVSMRCDGKKRCSVPVQDSIFSDPCYGIAKYLDVIYSCLPFKTSVTCEGSRNDIQCETGVIRIKHANYGRRDKTTCPHKQATTAECFSPQTKRFQLSCDGKKSCSLHASSSVLGDPCFGVHKYLEVAYICK